MSELYGYVARANYARLSKLILQDLNKNQKESIFFGKFTKAKIIKYLENPSTNVKNLRDASVFLYHASSHYRRLINYFARMALLYYVVIPYGLQGLEKKKDSNFKADYYKVLDHLNKMNIPHEFQKIMTVVFREDVFFGYCYEETDSFFIKPLPPDFCEITTIDDGVYGFSFDFSYFDSRVEKIASYGNDFVEKYNIYKGDSKQKWQELDSKKSICIKANEDTIYAVPVFAGVLESLYDIQDFKALQKARTEIGNYKLFSFLLPTEKESGELLMDKDLAMEFFNEILNNLPERVGAVLTPFEVDAHAFEKDTATSDNVANSEKEYFNAAGVSQMLFNGNKSSSAALKDSINSDFDMVCAVLRQMERWVNRKIKTLSVKNKFKMIFLDINRYNQADFFKRIKEACTLGAPLKMAMAASLGYSPSDTIAMGYLESDVLNLRDTTFGEPLLSSNTLSSDDDNVGKPKQDEVDTAGEITRENEDNLDR